MRGTGRWLGVLALVCSAAACSEGGRRSSAEGEDDEPLPWVGRTRGGAVVLSRDERIAVALNRSAGVVTVLELERDAPLEELVKGQTELDMGDASEPWAAVIGADDDTAYVVSRQDQRVTRISDLDGSPHIDGFVTVGAEPTAIAIAPSGLRLFVANWGEGTISVITTPDFGKESAVRGEWDLNAALAGTGVLGATEAHAGLAHPRALAVTDDGDDDDADETLFATEFFSMPLPDAGDGGVAGYFDRSRQGFVYPIALAEGRVGDPISIGPVDDTGFIDSKGAKTGCYPNQLYAAAADGNRLLVTSVCASPEGPLGPAPDNPANFKTVMHPAVFVIDTQAMQELPGNRMILSAELERRAEQDGEVTPRMALIPNDIAFVTASDADLSDERTACLTAMGADAVFCLHLDEDGRLQEIGTARHRYIDLLGGSHRAGRLPVGFAASRRRAFALTVNDNSQNLSVLDLNANTVRSVQPTTADTPRALEVLDSDANAGRRHFATGLSVWSFRGQAWASCEGCHPDGLSDGVTWFFSRGPRRTISTAPTYYDHGERRVLLWTGNVDEVHDVEVIVRSVAGGVGAIVWQYPDTTTTPTNDSRIVYDGSAVPPGKASSTLHQNLNASVGEFLEAASAEQICQVDTLTCDRSPVHDWDEIDAYVASVRAPRRPVGLDSQQVERGASLFRAGRCGDCHGGPDWTLSHVFYTPGAIENGALPFTRPLEVTDEELGLLRTETYSVPEALRALNPPGASGTATYRRWDPPADRSRVVHLYGKQDLDGYDAAATHGGDQINCVLRAVGTFPDQHDGQNARGIAPAESLTVVSEVRQDMTTLALGATGFNIPSLVGLASSAPYFHAGNARTLEELFDPAFARHYAALAPDFLSETGSTRDDQVADLIAYLLSIDDDKPTEPIDASFDLCQRP